MSSPIFVLSIFAVVFVVCIFVGTGGYRKDDYPE